jgi:hypothetical protein
MKIPENSKSGSILLKKYNLFRIKTSLTAKSAKILREERKDNPL